MNRRLVPMPRKRARAARPYTPPPVPPVSGRPQVDLYPTEPVEYTYYEEAAPVSEAAWKRLQYRPIKDGEAQAVAISRKLPRPAIDFGLVVLTAIAIYFLWPYRSLIMLIGVVVIAVRFWLFVCRRFPGTAWFSIGFIRGLLGWGYYRRW